MSDRDYANLALALEQELQRERHARRIAEETALQLQHELIKAGEEMMALRREIAELKGRR